MTYAKVCLIGAPGVGKTSLVKRFVDQIFDERYLTTVGVKVDKKTLRVEARDLTLMIWDLAGEDDSESIPLKYVRGAAAYILVADGCRPQTFEKAEQMRQRIDHEIGPLPFVGAVNKSDLAESWDQPAVRRYLPQWGALCTSAKTGAGVEKLFQEIARRALSALP
ncbi:MAG: GTP-binding protein [Bryobacteraceae bacterium]|nr:GTP-binding protein [Bryobacteraceae bacterium]MDW8376779.1 Rab family GTPase [Bryobacterales bacterium]